MYAKRMYHLHTRKKQKLNCHRRPDKLPILTGFLGIGAFGAFSPPSAARCHLSMSFETPWYGFSGEGDRTPGLEGSSGGDGNFRLATGLLLRPIGAGAGAGEAIASSGEARRGNPLTTPLISDGFVSDE